MGVECGVYFLGALLLLTLPLPWILAALGAAAFHECCHVIAVRLLGGQVLGARIGSGGAVLDTTFLPPGKELLCAAAGPIGALALLPLGRWLPRTALCAAVQSLFNLLPLYPLDGGRMLRCAVTLAGGTEGICVLVEKGTVCLLFLLGFYAVFILHLGILPLILIWMLVLKKNSLQRRETRGTIGLPNRMR